MNIRTLCVLALLLPATSLAGPQEFTPRDSAAHAERLIAARALAPDLALTLSGHFVNEALRDPVEIRFDGAGRLSVDYGGLILRDLAFDGERSWCVDGAGRHYEMNGTEREMQLALHGLLCGNWLSALEWELTSLPGGTLHAQLEGCHLEMELEIGGDGLPRRVDFDRFGRKQALRFSDWQSSDLSRWPARVELRDGPLLVGTFEFDRLVRSEDGTFGPPDDPGFDLHFDRDADPKLTVRRIASGHTFVRAEINGVDVGWLGFDTGASRSMLDARVADRLELESLIGGLQSNGAGGPLEISVRRADILRVGPLGWHDAALGVGDLSALERAFGVAPLAGLLGADLLAHAVWEYDLASARITIHPAGHAPEGLTWVRVELAEGQLIAPVEFEGHVGRFVVDTGGGSDLYFNAPTVERLDLLAGRRTKRTRVRGVGGLVTVREGPIDAVVFGGRSFERLKATFTSRDVEGSWCDPHVDGVAGIALLAPGPVWFDYPERRIGLAGGR